MFKFLSPFIVIVPQDLNLTNLRASLLTVLRVVYAIVRLSSGETFVGFDPPCGSHQLPVFLKYSARLKLLLSALNSYVHK